jgi:hypothetical protein
MEEVALVSEEMRRNVAHCIYEHSRWLLLANTKVDRGCSEHTSTSVEGNLLMAPMPDVAQEEGRRAYCLECACDEVVRAQQHAAKWLPLYQELQQDELMRHLVVDPRFELVATMGSKENSKGKARNLKNAANVDAPQQLVVELAEGLAMATLEDDYEPG